MNNNQQAKNGFKTFLFTLAISVALFGTAYYVLTNDISETTKEDISPTFKTQVVETEVEGEVAGESAFRDLIEDAPAVLAGTDTTAGDTVVVTEETDESTPSDDILPPADDTPVVPDTGSETLAGTVIVLGLVALAGYLYLTGPKFALSKFEKDTLNDL